MNPGKLLFLLVTLIFSLHANASKLEVYTFNPPKPIKWQTPSSLFRSTLGNAVSRSYASVGHYTINFTHDNPKVSYGIGKDGVKRILTGMERDKKFASNIETIRTKMGMSVLEYIFTGILDNAKDDAKMIKKAIRQNTVVRYDFDLTEVQADKIEQFLENWIRYGSYKKYAGNQNAARGDGAGCADFAMVFMNIASNGMLPFNSWVREVYVPNKLMKYRGAETYDDVRFLKLLFDKTPWAKGLQNGTIYSTPDPEMMYAWIRNTTNGERIFDFTNFDFNDDSLIFHHSAATIFATEFDQSEDDIISEQEIEEAWKRISLDAPLPTMKEMMEMTE